MAKRATAVRLSSKGQLVIPAALRRSLGLTMGQVLMVRAGAGRDLVLSPAGTDARDVETMLRRTRACSVTGDRDLVHELHARRRRERSAKPR